MHKRRIKFLSIQVTIVLAVALCPAVALAQQESAAAQLYAQPCLETQAEPIASGTWGTCPWEISEDGTLTVHPGQGPDSTSIPWTTYKDDIKKVVFSAEGGKKVVALNCRYLLEGLKNVISVDLSGLDTSKVKNMFDMFAGCVSLQSIDISGLDTSLAENMGSMFAGCTSLKSVSLAGLKTTNATDMSYMFSGCSSLLSVELPASSSRLTGLDGMFEGCTVLPYVDLSPLNTSRVTGLVGLFAGCKSLESANLTGLQTSKVTNMRYLFYECAKLRYVDLSSFDTSNVVDTGDMFTGCAALTAIDLGAKVTKLGTLPANLLNGSEKWYSTADGKWYTAAEIFSKRLGIADKYTKFDAANAAQYSLSTAEIILSQTSYTYDGTAKEPAVTVRLNNGEVPVWGYSVSYSGNVNVGTATVTVTGKGLYIGSASTTFVINGGSGSGGGSGGDESGGQKSDLASYLGKAKAAGFTDLDGTAWYMSVPNGAFPGTGTLYLDYTIGRGLMSGYSGTTLFGPDDSLDRGMAATIIYRMATGHTAATTNNDVPTTFSDVPAGQWYSAAVAWCAENGVITGYKDDAGNLTGRFGPGDPVTREQLTTMIARYCMKVKGAPSAGTDLSRFPDQGSVSDWATEGVAFCTANAIVSGYSHNGHFAPQDGATRCQMSKIIAVTARMLE